MQGQGLPDVAGPNAGVVRSADGSVFKAQPVPLFFNAELPGDAASSNIHKCTHWLHAWLVHADLVQAARY